MATEVLMPKMGLTMTEGTIEEWKFKEGDTVKKGDILFSVATDKLTNDVECEADGVLLKIFLPEGETGPCKSVIAYIGQPGEAVPGGSAAAAPAAPAAAPAACAAAPAGKKTVIVIGGCAGSFLGEYQAGGLIIVLWLNAANRPIVGNFPCTGMHGGKMVLRGEAAEIDLPPQVTKRAATNEDLAQILPYLMRFCTEFSYDPEALAKQRYTVIIPNSKNPYKQMYVAN